MQSSSSANSFATLTPANNQAKVAFHEVYDYFLQHGEAPPCFSVEPHQEFHRDIFLLRLRDSSRDDGDEASDTPTDPDTDLEENELRPLGLLWTGRYTFGLESPPSKPSRGWVLGRGRQDTPVDVQLTINRPHYEVRGFHALLNIHTSTGYLWICRATGSFGLELTVDGQDVGRGQRFALNQTPMRIRIGRCEYVFEYTEYARSNTFKRQQRDYMSRYLNVLTENINLSLTPTPNPKSRKIGDWTLGISLGKGTFGKVFAGTNMQNEIVAIKIVERGTRTQSSVATEIRVLEELKKLGNEKNDEGRLVRLREVIYQNGKEEYTSRRFEDVALILEPAVRGDFSTLVEDAASLRLRSGRLSVGIAKRALELFYDALRGVHFLHANNWLHGDIKPANIGIDGNKAVLLDLGSAAELSPGSKVASTPGRGGTIWYLAPEREMTSYDMLVDIWAMGIIGYELSYGYHPWKLKCNAWRRGAQFEAFRPDFHTMYEEAMEHLYQDYQDAEDGAPISLSGLLVQMLRHPWAHGNSGVRIGAEVAMRHPCWQSQGVGDNVDDRPARRLRQH